MLTQPQYYPQPVASPQPAQQTQRRLPGPANEAVQSVYGRPFPQADQGSLAAVPLNRSLPSPAVKMPKREAWGRFLAYEVRAWPDAAAVCHWSNQRMNGPS